MPPVSRASSVLLVLAFLALAPIAAAQNGTLWVLCQTSTEGPCGYPTNYNVTGPVNFSGTQTSVSYSVPPGDYTLQYVSGGPPGAWKVSIRPAEPVNVAPSEVEGVTIVFTKACISLSQPVVSAPSGPQTSNQYTLTWNQSSSSDDQWEVVELIQGVVQSTQIVTVPSATFSHTVNAPTTYTYRVRATNLCNQFSTAAEAHVQVFPTGYVPPARNPNFNFDGNADLLWARPGYNLFAQFMNGTAATGGSIVVWESNADWQVVGTGDTDLDGDTDILMQNATTREPFLYRVNGGTRIDGAQVFLPRTGDAAPPARYSNGRAIGMADFTGDGRSDILWRTSLGVVDVIELNGLTTVGRTAFWREPNSDWRIVAVADANGDGKADAYWRHASTGTCFLTLAGGAAGTWHHEPDFAWSFIDAADVDGDGKADAIWRHTDGRVWIQLRDGFGAGNSGVVWTEPSANWRLNGLADVNGDGRHDLIWRHSDGRVFVVLLDGLAVVESGVSHYEPDPTWSIVAPAGTTERF